MFKIELFCDDKRLPTILRSLASLGALNVTSVPVANAEQRNGKVRQQSNEEGLTPSEAAIYTSAPKGHPFKPKDAASWLANAGFSRSSTSSVLCQLVKAKRLKRTGKSAGTTYEVL